jgi:hypothetical protein
MGKASGTNRGIGNKSAVVPSTHHRKVLSLLVPQLQTYIVGIAQESHRHALTQVLGLKTALWLCSFRSGTKQTVSSSPPSS